jgi:hypothetical protein
LGIIESVASISQLEARLQHFDGKHIDSLFRIAAALPCDPSTIDELISLAERSDPPMQIGATWILKRFQSQNAVFSPVQVTKLIEQLCGSGPWESRLHLLQMLPKLDIPSSGTEMLFQFLVRSVGENNKFVRAWAYTALHKLATQHPDYVSEVVPLLANGQEDEAASVRARLRQLKALLP